MRAIVVVPLHPVPDDSPRFLKRLERVLPDALFFETAKEPFDDPVLLRRVRGHECVVQPIVPTRLPKLTALEDQAVVTAENRRSRRPQRSEPGETGGFHGALRRQMRPAIFPTGDMRHQRDTAFGRPAFKRLMGSGDSNTIATSLDCSGPSLEGGLNFKGCRIEPARLAQQIAARFAVAAYRRLQ